jgi:hypothetical protein
MRIAGVLNRVEGVFSARRRKAEAEPPRLIEPMRFPYGPFRFKTALPKGTKYTILASSDLTNWGPIGAGVAGNEALEYVDSDASKFNHRFYRMTAGEVRSLNTIGYASSTLPPGFSLIGNPLNASSNTVGEMFKSWPDRTTLNKFDTRLFRLGENMIEGGAWTNPNEKLMPGEGAILFNPTSEYKSHSFVGEVMEGSFSMPIPSGFSLRSCMLPQPGHLCDDLSFPISNGDVIHVFDRDQQKYQLHPFENGKWASGAPVLSVAEAFWVAKTEAGNWTKSLAISA